MSEELVPQLYPSEYDNLIAAGVSPAFTDGSFGQCSAINNAGTVFAIAGNRRVYVYTSNRTSTQFRAVIQDPEGNPNLTTYFGCSIAIDAAGDTLIIGSRGNNRAYVFDATNNNRTAWSQRKTSASGSGAYLSTISGKFGWSVDIADDDDSRFVIGNPDTNPKVEIRSWPKDSTIVSLKVEGGPQNSGFGYSCKISGDGKVVIIGAPGSVNPSVAQNSTDAYERGEVTVLEESGTYGQGGYAWNPRTMPWGTGVNIVFPTYTETFSSEFSNVKRVTNHMVENGGQKISTYAAFGHHVAINRDGSIIAASAPGRQCFFSASWEQPLTSSTPQYLFMTDKPIVNTSIGFGATLHMNYDGTRIIIGNGFVENTVYWDYNPQPGQPTTQWQSVSQGSIGNGEGAGPNTYNLMDWNGKNWANYHEESESKEFGGLPTSISKNGEFIIFSGSYSDGTLYGNEHRTTGSDQSWATGSTVFTFKRFTPTIKMIGKTSLGGNLDCASLTVGGDTSYLDSATHPGKLIFGNPVAETGLFESYIQNTAQYTGDIHKSELLIYKSGHVRGSNTHGPDRIRIKAPTICLEGMVFENNPVPADASRRVWSKAGQDYSKTLEEASGIYNRLTLTGLGNVGIGVPEFDDIDIKENDGLDMTTFYPNKRSDKTYESPNTPANPLINHRLVVAGSQDIQGGKLFINSHEASNVIVDGLSTHYNTMSKHCFFYDGGSWYCKNDVHERNPWWQFYWKQPSLTTTQHRYQLKLTLSQGGSAYNDTYNALVFNGSHINYANGRLMDVYCPITGDQLTSSNHGIITTSYWFMPLKAQNNFNNTIFGTKDPLQNIQNSISHIVTSSGFVVDYKSTPANMRYTTSYTFDQGKWYHICVKYDNTPGSTPNIGTATTQLWINGVSQTLQSSGTGTDLWQTNTYGSVTTRTVTVMDDAYFGNIPNSAGFSTGFQGTDGFAIGNFKHFIATDGTNYSAKRVVPDYNSATDLYNEGAPDRAIITSGLIKSRGLICEKIGIFETNPAYPLDVDGDINLTGSLRINGTAQTFGGGGGGGGGQSPWSTSGTDIYASSANVSVGTSDFPHLVNIVGSSVTYADLLIANTSQYNNSRLLLGTPSVSNLSNAAFKAAIIAAGTGTNSTSDLHFCLDNSGDNGSSGTADLNDTKMEIKSNGNVGIGTATNTPSYKLHVVGDIGLTGTLKEANSGLNWLPPMTTGGGIINDNGNLKIDLAAQGMANVLGILQGGTGNNGSTNDDKGLMYYDNTSAELTSLAPPTVGDTILLTTTANGLPSWGLLGHGMSVTTGSGPGPTSTLNLDLDTTNGGLGFTSGNKLQVSLDSNGGLGFNSSNELRIDFTNTSSIQGQLPASFVSGGGSSSSQWSYDSTTNPPELTFDSGSNGKVVGIGGTPFSSSAILTVYGTTIIDSISGGSGGISYGDLYVSGSVYKTSSNFRIDHPLPSMSNTHTLTHTCIESPKADLIYRGKVNLVNGSASINLDTVSNMTSGTFEALNRDVQCFTTNESDWDAIKGSVSGNTLTISCQNASSTANVSWLVIGERKDQQMYNISCTDDDGHIITEKAKST
jgi:hypothetical protein